MRISKNKRSGAVDPVTLVLIVVLGLGGAKLAGWKPLAIFSKKPPTEQVQNLQAELEKVRAQAEQARIAKEQAEAAERARKDEQIRYSQQMVTGAGEALDRLPVDQRTPETELAAGLLARADIGLAAAVGGLSPEKRAEILTIVGNALSKVEAERDAARKALEEKDRELRTVTIERERIQAQIPVLNAKLEAKEAKVAAVESELKVKTKDLIDYSHTAYQKEREAGSLSAALQRIIYVVVGLVGAWAFLAYVLPPILKLMRPGKAKNLLRDVSGYSTGGLLYHDAKKKLNAKKTP